MMDANKQLQQWVDQFAESVIRQTEEICHGDPDIGNSHAKRYIAIFNKLRAQGEVGRDALIPLLCHARADVRVMTAAFLLRHRTKDALDVLRRESLGRGLTAFEATQALKRWEEGDWSLDPV